VRQLDTHGRCLGVQEVGHPGEARDVLVGPQADVTGADAALRRHTGGPDDHEPEAAEREAAQRPSAEGQGQEEGWRSHQMEAPQAPTRGFRPEHQTS
jgi:hypothetical protein